MRPKIHEQQWEQIVQDAFASGAPAPHLSDRYCARRHEMEEELAMKEERKYTFQPGLVLATAAALVFAAVPVGLIWMLSWESVPVTNPDFQLGAAVTETMSEAAQPEETVPEESLTVPDVTSYQYEFAKKVLEQQGFQVDMQYELCESVSASGVIRTEPTAGSHCKPGETIILHVSKGAGSETVMENCVGMPEEAAKNLLEYYGLTVEIVNAPSDKPAGTVIEQSIPVGEAIEVGTTVTLTVSEEQ